MKKKKKKFSYKNIGKDYVETNGSAWRRMKWAFKYILPILILWTFLLALAENLADKFG